MTLDVAPIARNWSVARRLQGAKHVEIQTNLPREDFGKILSAGCATPIGSGPGDGF